MRSSTVHAGRHRAAPTRRTCRRAALTMVAAGAPLLPGALLAAPAAHAETDWDRLAECESGGDWSINTGNGFSGGLQFTPSTWKAFGGSGAAHNASRAEQIRVAERVKAEQGMNAWPTCSAKTGQTSDSPNTTTVSSESSETASEPTSSSGGRYTVKAGDTLSSIAATHGKSGWRDLQASNPDVLADPNMIFPGQTLAL